MARDAVMAHNTTSASLTLRLSEAALYTAERCLGTGQGIDTMNVKVCHKHLCMKKPAC